MCTSATHAPQPASNPAPAPSAAATTEPAARESSSSLASNAASTSLAGQELEDFVKNIREMGYTRDQVRCCYHLLVRCSYSNEIFLELLFIHFCHSFVTCFSRVEEA